MKNDQGNILIMAVIIAALLISSMFAYFRWAGHERWDSAYEEATVEAYFLAQQGLAEAGFKYLRTVEPGAYPTATVYLQPGIVPGVGEHYKNKVVRIQGVSDGNVFQRANAYDVYSTGRASFYNHELGNRKYGDKLKVERTVKMRVKLRSFSNYMYLTDFETTTFDEIIWFWEFDTLYGRTHSNDWIGIINNPHFFGPISTCQEDFVHGRGYNPYFAYPPQFNAPKVEFPVTAESLRRNAAPRIEGVSVGRMTRVWLRGNQGILIYQYQLGSEPPPLYNFGEDNILIVSDMPVPTWQGIFINGQCEIYGTITGKVTIGSSGNMWLVDNVIYTGANEDNGNFGRTYQEQKYMPNVLGLISEKNIIIRNNIYNGREDGFNAERNNQNRHSIVINAAMVALGESFTFEHQNDDWEAYQGPTPDERGIIHLVGAVTQKRRGYVHRSNHNSTGYGKEYHYDFRLDHYPPPYFLEALDEYGHGLFDIISFGEE